MPEFLIIIESLASNPFNESRCKQLYCDLQWYIITKMT
jgi:hypothetical protein